MVLSNPYYFFTNAFFVHYALLCQSHMLMDAKYSPERGQYSLHMALPMLAKQSMAKHEMKVDKKGQHTTQIAELAELLNVKGCFW